MADKNEQKIAEERIAKMNDTHDSHGLDCVCETCVQNHPEREALYDYDWEEEDRIHELDAQAEAAHDRKIKSRRYWLVGIWKERGLIDVEWNHAGVWSNIRRIALCVKASICTLLGIGKPEGVGPVDALHLFILDGGETGGSYSDPPDYWATDLCVPLKGWYVFTEGI